MSHSDPLPVDRRTFIKGGATAAASVALGTTALSYGRILGANDRISLGHIGIGNRGRGLAWIASKLKDEHNVEMTAVCDLWTVNREKAVARPTGIYGRAPRAFQHMEELLALKDVDAVIISTAENSSMRRFSSSPSKPARTRTAKSRWPTCSTRPRPRATRC